MSSIKTTIKIFMTGSVLSVILIVLAFAIPSRLIKENVKRSSYLINEEGVYPVFFDDVCVLMHSDNIFDLKTLLFNNHITARDNYTDSLMLLQAAYDGKESLLERAMAVYRYQNEDGSPLKSLDMYMHDKTDGMHLEQYDRYWHGYMVILRPLLVFFDLQTIRIINTVLMIWLNILICVLINERLGKGYSSIYLYALLFFMPFTIPLCMQYCTSTYVMLVTLFILLKKWEWLNENNRLSCFFLIIGMTVVYVDYLTFPLVTLGIPLIFVVCLDKISSDRKNSIFKIFTYCINWCIGYVGLWTVKWLISSVVLKKNVLSEAIEQVKFRSSSVLDGGDFKITIWKSLGSNLCNYVNVVYLVLIIVGLIFVFRGFYFLRKNSLSIKTIIKDCGVFLLIAMMPIAWFVVFKNHSYCHGSFTFRNLFITVLSGLIFIKNAKNVNNNIRE